MKLETLKDLLNISKRQKLFEKILDFLEQLNNINDIVYEIFNISEGTIPIIYIGKNFDVDKVKYVKIFVGAQHNEYNGLFGILEFLKMVQNQNISVNEISSSLHRKGRFSFISLRNSSKSSLVPCISNVTPCPTFFTKPVRLFLTA